MPRGPRRPTVEHRRAFRPDLRDAQLEDRTLLAGPAGIYPALVNPNGFNTYFTVWGFQSPLGGNNGTTGGQSLRSSFTSGVPATPPVTVNWFGAGLVAIFHTPL